MKQFNRPQVVYDFRGQEHVRVVDRGYGSSYARNYETEH